MKTLLFGATGMVGRAALIECLEDARVTSVLAVGRTSAGVRHEKLTELKHDDFTDFSKVQQQLAGYDACLYCVGVSSVGMSADKYFHLTYNLSMAAGRAVADANGSIAYCFVSAQGANSLENSRRAWGNVKGKTENDLGKLPFRMFHVFRPGLIQPMKGVTSRTRSYRVIYGTLRPFLPLLLSSFPNHVTTSVNVGRALIRVAEQGYSKRILENADINLLA